MKDHGLLRDKVCIITGAGKGIGRDCAGAFAGQGAKLALISRSNKDLIALEEELGLPEDRMFWSDGDVSIESVVCDFVAAVIEKFGRIDVLVNNAGIRMRKPFLEISHEEWTNVLNVNAGSVFLFCRAVGEQMAKQKGGRIINMASVIGTLGLSELAGYGASKGAVISLTKCLAVEWAEHNINVNAIAPGFCETSYADAFKGKTELYNFTLDRTPMGRWGKGRDVANACVFLASEMSDYVTGEVMSVDGGWSAW